MSLLSTQSVSAGCILVVDDDQRSRDRIVWCLRAAGHDVDPSRWARGPAVGRTGLVVPFVSALADTSGHEQRLLKVIKAPVLAKPLKVRALRGAVRAMLLGERAP
jgi:hypothetical protein